MRLVVRQDGKVFNEYHFDKGPIYIGRQLGSQVFLPDRAISRQHAVIYTTAKGQWVVEDLGSANKTYQNERAVHKAELVNDDMLAIATFSIEVHLTEDVDSAKTINLEDTLNTGAPGPRRIVRSLNNEVSPSIKMPAKRAGDFYAASRAILLAKGPDEILKNLSDIIIKQFSAYDSWCALRKETSGQMTFYNGKRRTGQRITAESLPLADQIAEAVDKKEDLLLPRVVIKSGDRQIRSALIAPVLCKEGCTGVLFVDNSMERERYTINDLDYLILISISVSTAFENFR